MHLAYVNLGFALAAQAKEKDARRAPGPSSQAWRGTNNLALAAEMRGRPEAARELYQKALPTSPTSRRLFQLRRWTHFKSPMKSMSITGLILQRVR